MSRAFYVAGWAFVVMCVTVVWTSRAQQAPVLGHAPVATTPAPSTGGEWFARAKPYCNAVEVAAFIQANPSPSGVQGVGYRAACLALAGRTDLARAAIDSIDADGRHVAAGIVFDIGHPVADAGDDRSAGPIMELVVDYWPNHYMALYHAGAAEFALGQRDRAAKNLEAFLTYYTQNDGWRTNAQQMLGDMRRPVEREP